jgi:hypothetical protein
VSYHNCTAGSNHSAACLLAATGVAEVLAAAAEVVSPAAEVVSPATEVVSPAAQAVSPAAAAFGVFRRFEVTNFDVFLSFFSHGVLPSLFVWFYCLCWITGTEQQLTSANDILFWNQVIEADQFFLPALWPMAYSLSGGRIFFVFRCVHFRAPCYHHSCQLSLCPKMSLRLSFLIRHLRSEDFVIA